MRYLADRLKEPSTKTALAVILGLFLPVAPAYTEIITSAIALLAAIAAIQVG